MPRENFAMALHADAGTVELTTSGYLVGFSLGQLLWARSAISSLLCARLPLPSTGVMPGTAAAAS
ncbi:hypothetical protein [Cupriavidus sp. YAF13]|uniref:hypothetical protein n=1 Tax=Cupriavidus sp. YAF13 TaxID=3233075 RepID=UPI003F93E6E2